MNAVKKITCYSAVPLMALLVLISCTPKLQIQNASAITKDSTEFLSQRYNHFEGGVIFEDIELGLDILWDASFKRRRPYKENLALFLDEGLLILPNIENTIRSARLSALPMVMRNGKPYVYHNGNWLKVLGIIHTHPDFSALPMPAPVKDFQLCYSGLHNYVMDHRHLYDAFKDPFGTELYNVLGPRTSYQTIPMVADRIVAAQMKLFVANDNYPTRSSEILYKAGNDYGHYPTSKYKQETLFKYEGK